MFYIFRCWKLSSKVTRLLHHLLAANDINTLGGLRNAATTEVVDDVGIKAGNGNGFDARGAVELECGYALERSGKGEPTFTGGDGERGVANAVEHGTFALVLEHVISGVTRNFRFHHCAREVAVRHCCLILLCIHCARKGSVKTTGRIHDVGREGLHGRLLRKHQVVTIGSLATVSLKSRGELGIKGQDASAELIACRNLQREGAG